MLILVLFLPLMGFISGSLFGRYLGKGVSVLTTFYTVASFIISFLLLLNVIQTGNVYKIVLINWICSDSLIVDWSFCFDSLTAVMLVVITFISSLVHLYSTEYMENDPHLSRFMSYLSLFTFFMIILVTSNNFLQMFVGWEGVGLSSYLLINFWFTRIQANKAAIKAMLVNRVGDFALLISIFTIYFVYGSLDYDVIFSLVPMSTQYAVILGGFHLPVVDLICILLFIGAMGKSAQLGLHTWLPDAMEGPTPVSALIHAATMVTAGVFLLSRCSYLFEFSPLTLNVVSIIGSSTAFFAATTGLFQNDMKRVIAYSTCSQLGYMIFACGLSSYEVGMFHLSNHAFFKALLFLSAGSVIHAVADEQDMRRMGGLAKILPFSYAMFVIGSLALIGFPFLAGFYSKDVILELSLGKYTVVGHFSYVLGILAAFCTSFYSTRLLYLVFLGEPNGTKKSILNAHEGGYRLTLPLFLLSILSISVGYLSKDLFIGFGTHFWGPSIFVNPDNYVISDIEFIYIGYKILPLVVTILGVVSAFFIYNYGVFSYYSVKMRNSFKYFYNFFNRKWYFDRIYNQYVTQSSLNLSYFYFYKIVDRGVLESFGPSGVIDSIYLITSSIKSLQNGFILQYLAYFLIVILFLLFLTLEQNILISLLFVYLGYFLRGK